MALEGDHHERFDQGRRKTTDALSMQVHYGLDGNGWNALLGRR